MKRFFGRMREYLGFFIDFLFPGNCIVCKKEIGKGLICNDCLNLVEEPNSPLCRCCGRPVDDKHYCGYCREDRILDHGRAFTLYLPPVDTMIHHFKYRHKTKIAEFFGMGMAYLLKNDFYLCHADLLVPVPLFWWKKLHRSYNQAELLARIISQQTSIPLMDALVRIRPTRTQTRLDPKGRRRNVAGAFRIKKGLTVAEKKVILIDDVMTTGATIKECARILKTAGAKEIYSLVAAITP
ncbi:MAG: ComF family protein [candidate division WOR-3 bacterium]